MSGQLSGLRAFDSLIDVCLAVDDELCVRYGNGPAAELLEASVKRLSSGKPLSQWLKLEGEGFDLGGLVRSGDSTAYREVSYATASGRTGWTQISSQPVPAEMRAPGERPLWLLYLRDVSLEKTLHDKYRAELAKLEDHSKNLEKTVESRTVELSEANRLLRAVLDSLGQGIVVFDANGRLAPMRSKVTAELFETSGDVSTAADLLGLQGAARASFERWSAALFADLLPFQDLVPLGPDRYEHSAGRAISLAFNPMLGATGSLTGVVMVATDRTRELLAVAEAERERRFAKMVTLVAGHRQQFRSFAAEARLLFGRLESACSAAGVFPEEEAGLWLHTLKGGASSFALDDVAAAAHECEDRVAERKVRANGDSALAFGTEFRGEMHRLIHDARERFEGFLVERAELFGGLPGVGLPSSGLSGEGRVAEVPIATLNSWSKVLASIPQAMGVRLSIDRDYVREPVARSFAHMDAAMQDLSGSLGKRLAPIHYVGGTLAIVPERWTELFATLVHAFRNAVDHGLESPEERQASGKDPAGALEVRFERVAGDDGKDWLRIEIGDDGRGIDANRLRAKLALSGRAAWAEGKSDEDVLQAVFLDDLSTKETVTEISGRGLGLAAVRAQAVAMGGTVRVESVLGQGSRLIIEAPETTDLSFAKRAAACP